MVYECSARLSALSMSESHSTGTYIYNYIYIYNYVYNYKRVYIAYI